MKKKTKKCRGECGIEKPLNEFNINKKNKDGLQGECKICMAKRSKEYYKKNKEILKKKKKKYKAENKEQISKQRKEYRKNNKEQISKYNKEYHVRNRDKILKRQKIHYNNNSERLIEYSKKYTKNNKERINKRNKERRKNDIQYRLICHLRARLYKSIKNNYKAGSAVRNLGCSIIELKRRLKSLFYPHPETGEEMTWENYGLHGWHIDHIIPLSFFNLENRKELLVAINYKNLQPMWATENLHKLASLPGNLYELLAEIQHDIGDV